ncbi:MAG: LysM peptidoglycan-binding domain-containing protein [Acidimicrobiia bacterium]
MTRVVRIAGWITGLVASNLLLLAIGPAVPLPHASTEAVADWFADVGPAGALMGSLRALAFAVVWYLSIVTVLGLVGRMSGGHRATKLIDRISVPLVRRMLGPALGTVMTVSTLTGTAGASAVPRSDIATTAGTPPVAVLVLEAPAPAPAAMEVDFEASTDPPVPAVSAIAVDTITVQPGDHFWAIAETRAASADHASVTEYWHRLIDANRDRLADPDNPDLLFAGQVLVLPQP